MITTGVPVAPIITPGGSALALRIPRPVRVVIALSIVRRTVSHPIVRARSLHTRSMIVASASALLLGLVLPGL